MKSLVFKRELIKIPFTSTDFTDYNYEIEFSGTERTRIFLETFKKEMTGKIKEKGRVGKFTNENTFLWEDNIFMARVTNSHREWYPVFFDYSGEDVTYEYE